jgi:hypothetical protein
MDRVAEPHYFAAGAAPAPRCEGKIMRLDSGSDCYPLAYHVKNSKLSTLAMQIMEVPTGGKQIPTSALPRYVQRNG